MEPCGLILDDMLIYEAARIAQSPSLRYHRSSKPEASHLRTFWIIYCMEKRASFCDAHSSVSQGLLLD